MRFSRMTRNIARELLLRFLLWLEVSGWGGPFYQYGLNFGMVIETVMVLASDHYWLIEWKINDKSTTSLVSK